MSDELIEKIIKYNPQHSSYIRAYGKVGDAWLSEVLENIPNLTEDERQTISQCVRPAYLRTKTPKIITKKGAKIREKINKLAKERKSIKNDLSGES